MHYVIMFVSATSSCFFFHSIFHVMSNFSVLLSCIFFRDTHTVTSISTVLLDYSHFVDNLLISVTVFQARKSGPFNGAKAK